MSQTNIATAPYAVTLADIEAAQARIAPHILRTPILAAPRLSQLTGADVYVKYENMQATASFKERGAVNKLLALDAGERKRGVIAMSAGNHAQAVAYHASRFGIPATIVMPEGTPLVKVENTRAHGAKVVIHGAGLSDAADEARRLARAGDLVFVHPYDDAAIMAGQGTIALEMLADVPDLDLIVIPIGGGGLISGNAVAAKALRPAIGIVGVEARLYPSFSNALSGADRPIGGATIAEGIAVKTVGTLPLPIVRDLVGNIQLVDEVHIERAVNAYATLQHTLAEGAGAAGLAAMMAEPGLFCGAKVGLLLCGGNIDARLLASIMVRELEREDRIASLCLTCADRPGLLGQVATRLGELGANILEVSHGRLFLDVPAKGVRIDVTIESRGAEHTSQILEALRRDGFDTRRAQSSGGHAGSRGNR